MLFFPPTSTLKQPTNMWVTCFRVASPSSRRSKTPVVQNINRVDDDVTLSRRICEI